MSRREVEQCVASVRLSGSKTYTCMDVAQRGDVAVLGSRKGLCILDLNLLCKATATSSHDDSSGFQVPVVADFITKVIPSPSPWDIGVVRWDGNGTMIASASNQKTHIWDARHGTSPLIVTLQKHFRPVTGIDWSPFYSTVLSTCSADSSIHLWDVRAPQREPIQSFMVYHQGAQAIAWNRHDGVQLASVHENEFRLWDTRKGGGGAIAHFIGHTQQITEIDFSHDNAHEFLTASNDKTVKLWDLSGSRVDSLAILQRVEPVHFAMFAPLHYGRGVLTNQYGIGEQADAAQTIRLWSVANLDSGFVPQCTFRGPSSTIVSVCWRTLGHGSDSPVQVASIDGTGMFWLHSVRQEDLNACIPEEPSSSFKEVTDGAEAPTFVPTMKNISLESLREDLLPEVSTSNTYAGGLWWDVHKVETVNVPGVVLEGVDAQTNTVDACITHFDIQAPATVLSSLYVTVSFPPLYPSPSQELPELQLHGQLELASKSTESNIISSGNSVTDPTSHPLPPKVLEDLHVLAMKAARRARASGGSCLESILRSLSDSLRYYVISLQGEKEEVDYRPDTPSMETGSDIVAVDADSSRGVDHITVTPQGKGGGDDGQGEEKRQQKSDVDPFEVPCPRLFSASFSRNNMLVIFGLSANQRTPFLASPLQTGESSESSSMANPTKEKCISQMPPRTYNLLLEAIYERLGMFHTLYYGKSGDVLFDERSSSSTTIGEPISYNGGNLSRDDGSSFGCENTNASSKSLLSPPEPLWAMQASQVNVIDFRGILPGNRLLAMKYVLRDFHGRNYCNLVGSNARGDQPSSGSLYTIGGEQITVGGDGRISSSSSLASTSIQTLLSNVSCIETTGFSQPQHRLTDQKQWDSMPIVAMNILAHRTANSIAVSPSYRKDGGSPSYFHQSPVSSIHSAASMMLPSGISKLASDEQYFPRSPRLMPSARMISYTAEAEEDQEGTTTDPYIQEDNFSLLDPTTLPVRGDGHFRDTSDLISRVSLMCKLCFQHNAQSAALVGENEIAAVWAVLTQVVEVCREFGEGVLECAYETSSNPKQNEYAMKKSLFLESCWEQSVLVGPLLDRVLDHYMRIGDPQTSAMLFCTLQSISLGKHLFMVEDEHIDRCIDAYADLLFTWGALHQRTELLKHKRCNATSSSKTINEKIPPVHSSHTTLNECKNIMKSCCSVCQLALRGIGIYCIACGHGGHPEHISAWFEAGNEACPTGCGCRCLEA